MCLAVAVCNATFIVIGNDVGQCTDSVLLHMRSLSVVHNAVDQLEVGRFDDDASLSVLSFPSVKAR